MRTWEEMLSCGDAKHAWISKKYVITHCQAYLCRYQPVWPTSPLSNEKIYHDADNAIENRIAPVQTKPKVSRRTIAFIRQRIHVSFCYQHVFLVMAGLQVNRLTGTVGRTIRGLLVSSTWTCAWNCCWRNAITSNTWLGTSQTCSGKRRTKFWAWWLTFIPWGCYILPLLEAKSAHTNQLFLSEILSDIGINRDKIRGAFSTENPSTFTAMVSAIEDRKLGVTFITNHATIIGHPKVPRNRSRFSPPRNPGFQYGD